MPARKKKSYTIKCSVVGCHNEKKFHFPKDPILKKKWLQAIRRENFTPNHRTHGLCPQHFSSSDFTHSDLHMLAWQRSKIRSGAVPSIFPWNDPTLTCIDFYEESVVDPQSEVSQNDENVSEVHSLHQTCVALATSNGLSCENDDQENDINGDEEPMSNNGPVSCGPSNDHLSYCLPSEEVDSARPMSKPSISTKNQILELENASHDMHDLENIPFLESETFNTDEIHTLESEVTDGTMFCNVLDHYEEVVDLACDAAGEQLNPNKGGDEEFQDTQTSDNVLPQENMNPDCNTQVHKGYDIENFRHRSEAILHFTGLENYDKFMLVLQTLGPAAYHLKYVRNSFVGNISIPNQFFLVLWKLRRNECDLSLAIHFNISRISVGVIFITWINFMSQHWSLIDLWPSRDLVELYMPDNFKENHRSTRVIIDGTEFPIQRPRDPRLQQSSFSVYKNENTMKASLGFTPGGLMAYHSPAYGGSTNDRQILERCDLLKKCEPGDSIMADKGFSVQDICAPYGVTCKTPNFVKKGCLTHEKVMTDRHLSKLRVHVERGIGLMKTFRILKSPLNHNYVKLASGIVGICVMLSNFKENIMVPRDGSKK
ncbi:hypothetical protein QAD02_012895 [Eretmocerus hayati]|uniref:Uncharacterized protein n=1 Tax=Eretmocerus hayati TaxID=131215 RepID=A0ACC2P0X1_9HYME|nr:hypothetical protein QAD02_012895 [Eretmocerus hayati]